MKEEILVILRKVEKRNFPNILKSDTTIDTVVNPINLDLDVQDRKIDKNVNELYTESDTLVNPKIRSLNHSENDFEKPSESSIYDDLSKSTQNQLWNKYMIKSDDPQDSQVTAIMKHHKKLYSDQAINILTNIKPGSVRRSLTRLKNKGSLKSEWTFVEQVQTYRVVYRFAS